MLDNEQGDGKQERSTIPHSEGGEKSAFQSSLEGLVHKTAVLQRITDMAASHEPDDIEPYIRDFLAEEIPRAREIMTVNEQTGLTVILAADLIEQAQEEDLPAILFMLSGNSALSKARKDIGADLGPSERLNSAQVVLDRMISLRREISLVEAELAQEGVRDNESKEEFIKLAISDAFGDKTEEFREQLQGLIVREREREQVVNSDKLKGARNYLDVGHVLTGLNLAAEATGGIEFLSEENKLIQELVNVDSGEVGLIHGSAVAGLIDDMISGDLLDGQLSLVNLVVSNANANKIEDFLKSEIFGKLVNHFRFGSDQLASLSGLVPEMSRLRQKSITDPMVDDFAKYISVVMKLSKLEDRNIGYISSVLDGAHIIWNEIDVQTLREEFSRNHLEWCLRSGLGNDERPLLRKYVTSKDDSILLARTEKPDFLDQFVEMAKGRVVTLKRRETKEEKKNVLGPAEVSQILTKIEDGVVVANLRITIYEDEMVIDGEDYRDLIPLLVQHEAYEAARGVEYFNGNPRMQSGNNGQFHVQALQEEYLMAAKLGKAERLFDFLLRWNQSMIAAGKIIQSDADMSALLDKIAFDKATNSV